MRWPQESVSSYPIIPVNTPAGRVTGGGSRQRILQRLLQGQKACLHVQDASEGAKGVKIAKDKRKMALPLVPKSPSVVEGLDRVRQVFQDASGIAFMPDTCFVYTRVLSVERLK